MEQLPESAVMVVHGPEIFDSGEVAWLMDVLSCRCVIVAGVMARTAAEESGLAVEFNAQPPSRVILGLDGTVFLANRGKNAQTGELFGNIVASRLGDRGLVHLECSSRTIYCWNGGDKNLAGLLARLTHYAILPLKSSIKRQERVREIRGCIPGEVVYVNGIVIGRATADTIVLCSNGTKVIPCSGLDPKPHGLEKLSLDREIDINNAWCKSGPVRSAAPHAGGKAPRIGRVLVIDHCGHEIYARMQEECCGVLAIGDDTTSVCGHICAHYGLPVFGIADGDRDTIVPQAYAPGTVVVETLGERDDDVGKEIAHKVPDIQVAWDDWVLEVLDFLKERVRIVIDLRKHS